MSAYEFVACGFVAFLQKMCLTFCANSFEHCRAYVEAPESAILPKTAKNKCLTIKKALNEASCNNGASKCVMEASDFTFDAPHGSIYTLYATKFSSSTRVEDVHCANRKYL